MNNPLKIVHVLIPTTEQRRKRLQKCIDSIHENAGHPVIISTYENKGEGFVTPCWKLLRDLKPDTLVWCIGDDTILNEPDTVLRLYIAFEKQPKDCVVQPDDGIQHGSIITMPFCTAQTMLDHGIHLEFFLNFCDNIFTEIMKKRGKYVYAPEIKVDHQHWVNKKAEKDETYDEGLKMFEQDQQTYYKIKHQLKL